ncbi:hypothetical protein [Marinicrinis sediminis]|uniref:Uncharacterized protein n=1 Tax=Marinicrinis sediminis TaxID=1652465 RepID=A0ABW5RFU6_9BACL
MKIRYMLGIVILAITLFYGGKLLFQHLMTHKEIPSTRSVVKLLDLYDAQLIGPFESDLMDTSPYLYGFYIWEEKGQTPKVAIVDQHFGNRGRDSVNSTYLIIHGGTELSSSDQNEAKKWIEHSSRESNEKDVLSKHLIEFHRENRTKTYTFYKLRSTNAFNLDWISNDSHSITTFKEGYIELKDY